MLSPGRSCPVVWHHRKVCIGWLPLLHLCLRILALKLVGSLEMYCTQGTKIWGCRKFPHPKIPSPPCTVYCKLIAYTSCLLAPEHLTPLLRQLKRHNGQP